MKATFYVVFDAEVQGKTVRRVRAKRMTANPPALGGGEVALRFVTDIPDSAFLRLVPSVEVEIKEGFWTSQPMTVHVEEPPSAD